MKRLRFQTETLPAIIAYEAGEAPPVNLGFDPDSQRIWATQADMAALYRVDVSRISRHISAIFAEGELSEEGNLRKTQITSFKPTTAYSLDVVISVGYRTDSPGCDLHDAHGVANHVGGAFLAFRSSWHHDPSESIGVQSVEPASQKLASRSEAHPGAMTGRGEHGARTHRTRCHLNSLYSPS